MKHGLSANTLGKYLRHLRVIFRYAAKVKLIDPVKVNVPNEDVEARPFTDAEVEHIYRSLAVAPVMQIAFVLAIGTGARFSDLFWFDWPQIDFEKRQVSFVAVKTGKYQIVPLTEMPLLHLSRLKRDVPPFASLIDQSVPEDDRGESQHVYKLNARWRALTGFTAPPKKKKDWPEGCVPHPWHSARSTAGCWIESRMADSASKLLGHAIDGGGKTTQIHYLVPIVPADLRAAAEAIAWPAYFRDFEQSGIVRQRQLF